jgi:hypothetical protein
VLWAVYANTDFRPRVTEERTPFGVYQGSVNLKALIDINIRRGQAGEKVGSPLIKAYWKNQRLARVPKERKWSANKPRCKYFSENFFQHMRGHLRLLIASG